MRPWSGALGLFYMLTTACDDPEALSFEEDIAGLIEAQCIQCHNASTAEAGLDLNTSPYLVLTEQDSGQSSYPLVTPSDSLQSYLWHKMNGSQALAGGSGTSMPLGQVIDEATLDQIALWINTGALP